MSRVNDFWTATHTGYRPGNQSPSPGNGDGQFIWDHHSAFQNPRSGTPVTGYRPFEERPLLRPFRVTTRIPMDPNSRATRIIIVNNNFDHGTSPPIPPFLHQLLRRPITQGNMYVPPTERDESKLTKQEQETALNNLHRQKYNHVSKIARKVNLYYRDLHRDPNSREVSTSKDDDGKNCAVCLEDFERGEEVMVTPCKHMFHEECVVPWVKNHGKCPVCRSGLCETVRENEAGLNRRQRGAVLPPAEQGLFSDDILSLIRAVDEAFVLGG